MLHLRSGTGSLALVQCDLLGGSAVLQRLVARALAERTDIPRPGVCIGATHTHGGPGQFLGTDFYNRFASNKPGFDAGVGAVPGRPHRRGVGRGGRDAPPGPAGVGPHRGVGPDPQPLAAAHVRNADVADRRTRAPARLRVGRPPLHLLRVDAEAADGGPRAAGGDGRVLGARHRGAHALPTYNADLWAYLTDELASASSGRTGVRPVVGAIEGTHADVAPGAAPGMAGHLEARRVGRGIGARAAELYAVARRASCPAASRWRAGCARSTSTGRATIGGVTLPRRPAVGAALVAGAYENETPVIHRVPPFRPGAPRRRADAAQGGKRVIGGPFQRLVLPLRGFPRVLPVQVVRVGEAAVVGLPFELTVETGPAHRDGGGGRRRWGTASSRWW